MKGNIKKLAVIVMMIAVTTFMVAAMVSADDHNGWAIHGEYAVIGTGSCLHSTLGFQNLIPPPGSPVWTPITGSVVWGAPIMWQGIWTFERDGTAVASLTNNIITLPPGDPLGNPPTPPGTRPVQFSFPFTYQVTPDGEITVAFGQMTLIGMVSMDHKTLTLGSANQVQQVPGSQAICNVGCVLIRLGE